MQLLNKNKRDKAWRRHHTNCIIRQAGDWQNCFSLNYQGTPSERAGVEVFFCFCFFFSSIFRRQRAPSLTRVGSVWVECQGGVGDCRFYRCREPSERKEEPRLKKKKTLGSAAQLSASVRRLIPRNICRQLPT